MALYRLCTSCLQDVPPCMPPTRKTRRVASASARIRSRRASSRSRRSGRKSPSRRSARVLRVPRGKVKVLKRPPPPIVAPHVARAPPGELSGLHYALGRTAEFVDPIVRQGAGLLHSQLSAVAHAQFGPLGKQVVDSAADVVSGLFAGRTGGGRASGYGSAPVRYFRGSHPPVPESVYLPGGPPPSYGSQMQAGLWSLPSQMAGGAYA